MRELEAEKPREGGEGAGAITAHLFERTRHAVGANNAEDGGAPEGVDRKKAPGVVRFDSHVVVPLGSAKCAVRVAAWPRPATALEVGTTSGPGKPATRSSLSQLLQSQPEGSHDLQAFLCHPAPHRSGLIPVLMGAG